ncbi:hypothetical protein A8V23_18490 [Yersinia pestis]|nr:hypothetical protein BAY22_01570 [Yersinia pestis]EIQ96736.1 hypothetical protein YPPY03_0732 [Yersinia pestis PY-03]EIR10979.1 hypothetical protein YPPY06_0764 [Yersinia pestis PY-06]EIR23877.1 hypothetical protein YPPY08_0776 [Yersinia pestis PY-08]EIR51342.1 hypothetical protein YPPY13_0747 [Yersinia pestis PY-13]EIR66960.1 hypothetical protein YPPY19_0763 [Yersinia pestis PY-19]EIR68710.1 hypothetical protein YPPY25_0803 [Yersinia pestis PY-25]EIR83174.1 hypothetical protein YPPY32_09
MVAFHGTIWSNPAMLRMRWYLMLLLGSSGAAFYNPEIRSVRMLLPDITSVLSRLQ